MLQEFELATVQRRKDLGHCPVGLCVQINNAIATFFGCGQNGVGRDEPDTAENGIKLYERLRLVQGVIKGVRELLRCFGDEISVENLALARFRLCPLANRLVFLRYPGGGDRRRRATH